MRCGTSQVAITALLMMSASALWGQDQSAKTQAGSGVAEPKSSLAANQAKLRTYQWTRATEVNIKGKTRKDEPFQCRYGPDGKVEKTPVGPPPEQPKEQPHGLKRKVVEKKVGEMKDYMDRLKSLIGHYATSGSRENSRGERRRSGEGGNDWRGRDDHGPGLLQGRGPSSVRI